DGVRLAGIVGLDVIGDRTLVFDLPRHRVSLLPSGHRPSGVMGRATRASTIAGGLLTIPVKVGSLTAIAVIDTGARKTRINWALGRLLNLNPAKLVRGITIHAATINSY